MFTLTLTFLGVLYLLGEQGVRLGSLLVPRVDPLLSLVIFVLCVALTTTRAPVRVIGLLVTLGVLTGVAVLLRAWHPMLSDPPSPFIGSVSELDESTALNKRTVMLPLLQVRSGRHLRQLVGRRQNVAVDTSGYMRVDQTGLHRLRLRCDDHCILRVNGETVADVSGFGSIEVYLDEGVYPFSLRYEQGVGPAVMTLDWNRPALVELLPLEAYMGGRAESLTSHRLNRKRLGTILWLTLAGLWCALASITLVRAGASGRALLQRLYSLIEWRRLAESLTLLWVSPRLRTLLVFSFDLLLYVVVYPRFHSWQFALATLSPASYYEPVLFLAELWVDPTLALGWLLATIVLVVGFRRLRWSEFEDGRKLRYFVFFTVLILAWAFSAYDYNFYFDQTHYVDRLLLIALAMLVLVHPGFVLPFLLEAIAIAYQFHHPLGGTWTDKKVVFDVLVLFNLFLFAKLIIRKQVTRRFLFFALCLLATHYFSAAVGKLELDWLRVEQLDNLVAASYSNGWLYFVSEGTLLRILEIVEFMNFPLILGSLLIEFAAVMILLRHKLTQVLLFSFIVLHSAIFLSSGIFFWKWILLDAALMVLLRTLDGDLLHGLYRTPVFLVSLPLIVFASNFYPHVGLAWYDTTLNTSFELEAVGVSGKTYAVPRGLLAPYDLLFSQNRFAFLSQDKLLVGIYGTSFDDSMVESLQNVSARRDLAELEAASGRVFYNEVRAQRFDHFLQVFFGNLNRRGPTKLAISFVGAPHHIWNGRREEPIYRYQEEVRWLRVSFVKSLYANGRILTLENKVIRRIEIPKKESPARRADQAYLERDSRSPGSPLQVEK